MAGKWKPLRSDLLWVVFNPLMFLMGAMADSTSSNIEYDIQLVICGTWSAFGVISGIGTIAGAFWAMRLQVILRWIVFAAFAVFGVALVFSTVRIAAGFLFAIAAVALLTGMPLLFYVIRRQR